MSNKIHVYSIDISPPCRAVAAVAYLIGLEIEIKNVDLLAGEHLTEWYLKLNPEHTVPTLDDNGCVIWDSHAICAYLIDKYANTDSLYPKDLFLRAKVNQRLFFDAAVLFPRLRNISISIFREGKTEVSQDRIDEIYEGYDVLETILSDDFLVGNTFTLADLCTSGTVTSLNLVCAKILADKYPKITAWLERIKKMPFYANIEKNGKHIADYKQLIEQYKEKNKNRK